MYQMSSGSPFSHNSKTNVCTARGGRGEEVRLLGDVPEVWGLICDAPRFRGVRIAIASCCDEPKWAHELLRTFEVGAGRKMWDCVAHAEIHYGSKQGHLRSIAQKLGISLEHMVFFDDQMGHIRDARALGVTAVHTPRNGVTWAAFEEALRNFANK